MFRVSSAYTASGADNNFVKSFMLNALLQRINIELSEQ